MGAVPAKPTALDEQPTAEPVPNGPTLEEQQRTVILHYETHDRTHAQEIRRGLSSLNYPSLLHDINGSGVERSLNEAIVSCACYTLFLSRDSLPLTLHQLALAKLCRRTVCLVVKEDVFSLFSSLPTELKVLAASCRWVREGSSIEEVLVHVHRVDIYRSKDHFLHCLAGRSAGGVVSAGSCHRGGFWDRHFANEEEVLLTNIFRRIRRDYEWDYEVLFGGATQTWVGDVLQHWCFHSSSKIIPKECYLRFLAQYGGGEGTKEGSDTFWELCKGRFERYVVLRMVFELPSTTRRTAISHLSSIPRDDHLLQDLAELLSDPDADLRCAACVALGQTGQGAAHIEQVMGLLHDTDRLVRKFACLSISRLLAETGEGGVTEEVRRGVLLSLTGVWRRDPVQDVRRAALQTLTERGNHGVHEGIRSVLNLEAELDELVN